MNHDELENRQIPERYLLGQLSEEENAHFEEHYLECPACLERLEIAERFQAALRDVAAQDAARASGREPAWRLGVFAALARLRRGRRVAWAAVFFVTLLLPAAFLLRQVLRLDTENARLQDELARARAPQAHNALLRLSPERGRPGTDGPTNRITLTSEPEWIVLMLVVEETGERTWRAELLAPDGTLRWQSDALARDPSGAVWISLHSTTLEAGEYELRLEGLTAQGEIRGETTFRFRVLPAS